MCLFRPDSRLADLSLSLSLAGGDIPQGRRPLHGGQREPGVLELVGCVAGVCPPVQDLVQDVSLADHGRGAEYAVAVSDVGALWGCEAEALVSAEVSKECL